MRKKIYDPNQLNIKFPEENIDKKEENISKNIENIENIENDNSEAFAIAQDKELDLIASQKAQEEALNNINTFPAEKDMKEMTQVKYIKYPNVIMIIRIKSERKKKKGVFLMMLAWL